MGILVPGLLLERGWVGKPFGVGALVLPAHWWDAAFR